ncbi:hypothetical protein [Thalassotalea mangrovi]|uniref:Uncharacterized protein n=1 Tax=Thalassotalea mangrovi TaxID=2572245 RepID=A0A4U1B2E6_9GAMM|nr:hypothetical protein [Thalassotalea mangrovi]TKB43560.1 hypothetical protein E8M12_14795 [Thalassotalea mangrovi]
MKSFISLLFIFFSFNLYASTVGDCTGTPDEAVTKLPEPLNKWGQLVCTPYGHIISNKEGWIWSNPGSYSPVMIPSQMVQSNPEPLGNKSYFTKIQLVKLNGTEASNSIKVFEKGFDKSEQSPTVYSLQVASISGKELAFQFFDYGNSKWGMWCNNGCDPNSKFMLLNMAEKP